VIFFYIKEINGFIGLQTLSGTSGFMTFQMQLLALEKAILVFNKRKLLGEVLGFELQADSCSFRIATLDFTFLLEKCKVKR
jgi:hypothetical protein